MRDEDLSPSLGSSLPELLDLGTWAASGDEVFLSSQHVPHGWDAGLGNHSETLQPAMRPAHAVRSNLARKVVGSCRAQDLLLEAVL